MQIRNLTVGRSLGLTSVAGIIILSLTVVQATIAEGVDSSQSSSVVELVDFGSVGLGSSIVRSKSLSTAGLGPILVTGNFAQTNNCDSPRDGRCTVSITFTPTKVGLSSGILMATALTGSAQKMLVLYGSGLGVPKLSKSQASLFFEGQAVGTSSEKKTV